MEKTVEVGTARSDSPEAFGAAREAAAAALAQVTSLAPSLALVFASAAHDPDAVARGVASILGRCPTAGTSSAGEVCGREARRDSVVVTVIASPHLSVEVGVGQGVSRNWEGAIREALPRGPTAAYFKDAPKLGRPFYFTDPAAGLSPLFVLLFSPGMSLEGPSRAHEIHSFLKRRTLGRVPIVGGSSSTPDLSLGNYQLANGRAYRDAVVMAVVETDLLFGEAVAHGFRPTRRRAVVTRTEGHVVHELDDRSAAEVSAALIGVSLGELRSQPIWFSRRPFGTADAFGQHHLLVPERVLDGGGIQFAPTMEATEAITLMEADPERMPWAAHDAVRKAMEIGRIREPAAILLFTCSLRYELDETAPQVEAQVLQNVGWDVPISGFLTFGEYGITEEGLPIYCNQSIVALVLGRELDESAVVTRRAANLLQEVERRLDRKSVELAALRRASQIVPTRQNLQGRLEEFRRILQELTGASVVEFHLSTTLLPGLDEVLGEDLEGAIRLPLVSFGEDLGAVLLHGSPSPESLEVARSIAEVFARALHRVSLERTIEEQAGEIGTLYNTAREIVTARDYRTAVVNIAQEIRRHMGASGFELWLSDDQGELVCDAASAGHPSAEGRDAALGAALSRSIESAGAGRFVYLASPLLFKDRVNGALALRFAAEDGALAGRTRFLSHLSIPLAVMLEFYQRYRESNVAREIHHRVKNNLQIIASLLNLQLRRLRDPEAREAIETSTRRIMSIAVVHEALCEKHVGHVEAVSLVRTVADFVTQGMADPHQELILDVEETGSLRLSSQQATNLAIVTNELLGNALKHGVHGAPTGRIRVQIAHLDGQVVLSVTDDGKGLPADFDLGGSRGLGLQLISTIAQTEFGGQFMLQRLVQGTEARLTFPLSPEVSPRGAP